ncbi:helix-turn-helix transcriptional regulator [Salsipaludibacter albus]|uniref:helix-turn-helix transcriptional regulator n=1 Tax=Salsipaludibacter albus TaxID=2849650 RepID=UPI001EE3EE00|nr:winged helix-turn-helix domain-containing protein [Salsipaludibacter albus]MBY5161006.1 winged helix-turn-helix domain-containing protein [Salsipaludibacter albus]
MSSPDWTLLSNHGHVLVALAQDPDARIREIATEVGITERAVQAILADLCAAGYVGRERRGRRNHYHLDLGLPMRHPLERGHVVGELLEAIGDVAPGATSAGSRERPLESDG